MVLNLEVHQNVPLCQNLFDIESTELFGILHRPFDVILMSSILSNTEPEMRELIVHLHDRYFLPFKI